MAHHEVQTPPTAPPLSSKHTLIMDKLKNSILKFANSDPKAPLTPAQIAFIEKQLLSTFHVFHTPTHPTYSSMIENAVRELNEEDGSDEKSISKYIKEKYDGLPWAHAIYVCHHLRKMCKNGEIICTSSKLYTTPTLIEERNLRKEQLEVRLGTKRKEGDSGGEEVVGVSGEEIGFQEEDLIVYRRRRRSFVVEAEDDEVGEDGGEYSIFSSGENLMVEKCNEVGVLEDDDDVTERSGVNQGSQSCVVGEEDDELEEIAGVRGLQNISGSSQKLIVEKCNETLGLEDGVDVTGRSRVKQRRGSYSIIEEDDEVGEAGVVGGEKDNDDINPIQNLGVEKCCETITQSDAVTGKVCGPFEEGGGIGTVGEDHDLVIVPDDECEGKTKPELLVPSSVETLCAERKCEVTNVMVSMPDDNSTANFVVVPVNSVEKSSLNDASVLNIRVDIPEVAVNDSVLKESDIVPFEVNAPIAAVSAGITPLLKRGGSIICGLAVPELEKPKQKQQVYFQKKRSKACQEIMKVLSTSEASIPVADVSRILLQHVQLHEPTYQKVFETKNPDLQIEDLEQTDVRLQDPDVTVATFIEKNVPTANHKFEQKNKLVKRELRIRAQKQLEIKKEDVKFSSNEHYQLQKGLSKPDIDQNLKQKIKFKETKSRGRPRKQKVEVVDLLNLHSQLPGLSEPAIGLRSLEQKKGGRGRPPKRKKPTLNNARASSNLLLEQQAGFSKTEFNQDSQLQIIHPKKKGRGRPRKQKEVTEVDKIVSSNLFLQLQEGESKSVISPESLDKVKLLEIDSFGKLWKQMEVIKEDAGTSLNSHLKIQDKSKPETDQHFQQSEVQRPNLRNKRMASKLKEARAPAENEFHYQECDGPYAKPEESMCEGHRTPETGQAMPPSDDDHNRQLKKRKLHIGGQRPKTRALTTTADNQSDQQQEMPLYHEHDKQQEKFEGQSRPPKEKSVKVTVVPLASKVQLRSRGKCQSQDST